MGLAGKSPVQTISPPTASSVPLDVTLLKVHPSGRIGCHRRLNSLPVYSTVPRTVIVPPGVYSVHEA